MIYDDWPGFEPYEAFNVKSGIFDTTPLKNLLENIFKAHDYKLYRKMVTGSVDAETGQTITTDFDDLMPNEYSTAVVASASVPGVFPFTELRGKKLIDSMSSGWNVNMITAIRKCLEIVDDPSKIVLDIITMNPIGMKQ